MKRCSKCKVEKSESDFYKDIRTTDGLKSQCKKCHLETSVITRNINKKRQSNKMYMRRVSLNNPQKVREWWNSRVHIKGTKTTARTLLNAAVRSGKIIKPDACQECGEVKRITAHHNDYNNPLEVVWLCYECHAKKHRVWVIGFERIEGVTQNDTV
jgi:hypothetical protein